LQADIKWWTEHGGLPEIYKLDNEISQSVLTLLKQKNLTLQTAPPNDHRQNRAERAIGTAKPHFLEPWQLSTQPVQSISGKISYHRWNLL